MSPSGSQNGPKVASGTPWEGEISLGNFSGAPGRSQCLLFSAPGEQPRSSQSPGTAREQPRSSKGAAQEQQGSSQSPETAREQPSAQKQLGSSHRPNGVSKSTWKPRARRSQLRDPQNRLPSALGEPPGRKKNFGNFQKRPRGILERFHKKRDPSGRVRSRPATHPQKQLGSSQEQQGSSQSPETAREQPRSSQG